LKSASLQYANALADTAQEQGVGAPIAKQLTEFAAAYASSAELRNFLGSPAVGREEKHGVVEKLTARMGLSKILRNFLYVVIDHRRTYELPEIVTAFQTVIRERQGIAEAEIASAVALTEVQKKNLLQTLEELTRKKIEAKFSLDPALLGGAVVKIGSTIYDGSVRSRLEGLRAKLAAE
jgi:F-type H+-transporting ATPase subunit delta